MREAGGLSLPRLVPCVSAQGRIIVDHAGTKLSLSDLDTLEHVLRTPLDRLVIDDDRVETVLRRVRRRERALVSAAPVAAFNSAI